MIKLLAQQTQQIQIPPAFQEAIKQMIAWVWIAAFTIPIIILLLLIARYYAEKGLDKLADKIKEWLNKKK